MSPSGARLEDQRLLTGRGRFLEDFCWPEQAHACFLRSPYAHARVCSTDTAQATASPGVAAVYTHADLVEAGLGALPCVHPIDSADGTPMHAPPRPLLAGDEVRYAGEGVAMVVAETLEQARDASERIEIEYEPLPVSVELRTAPEVSFEWQAGDAGEVERALARAANRCAIELDNTRLAITPIETRGAVGMHDRTSGGFTLYTQTQGVHLIRRVLAESVFGVDPGRLRVVTGDVGGSFGMKLVVYPEQALVLFAARDLGRPIRWIGDRSDAFLADVHGRDHTARAELGLDEDGRITALRADVRANLGAYVSTLGAMVPTVALSKVFGHVYAIPALYLNVTGVLTHTTPIDAYRGAGKPEIVYLVERLIEKAALDRGLDRIEFRRRNLVSPAAMPYTNALGNVWDCGNFPAVLDKVLEVSDWHGFDGRRRRARDAGRLGGIGLGMYLHVTGGNTAEVSAVELTPEGVIEVRTGTQAAGQGHETAFARIAAERLQVPVRHIRVVQGDSGTIGRGGGTGGSSSMTIGATTVDRAGGRFLSRARDIAADLLEAAAEDLGYSRGRFEVSGTDLGVDLLELAGHLDSHTRCVAETGFDGENCSVPNGAYVCEVSVDPQTGAVFVEGFWGVDDLGRVMHPAIAEGQIQGGVAQAIGQALMERLVYDRDTGQLLSGSLMDYCLPRAGDLPWLRTTTRNVPTGNNALGVKGAGECGTIGATAACVNAVCDALGCVEVPLPLSPHHVWKALRQL